MATDEQPKPSKKDKEHKKDKKHKKRKEADGEAGKEHKKKKRKVEADASAATAGQAAPAAGANGAPVAAQPASNGMSDENGPGANMERMYAGKPLQPMALQPPQMDLSGVLSGQQELWVVQVPMQFDIETLSGRQLVLADGDLDAADVLGRVTIDQEAADDMHTASHFAMQQEAPAVLGEVCVVVPDPTNPSKLRALLPKRRLALVEDLEAEETQLFQSMQWGVPRELAEAAVEEEDEEAVGNGDADVGPSQQHQQQQQQQQPQPQQQQGQQGNGAEAGVGTKHKDKKEKKSKKEKKHDKHKTKHKKDEHGPP